VELATLEIIENYRQWLEILGYSPSLIKNNTRYAEEFLTWSKISDTKSITARQTQNWGNYLLTRKHKRKESGLSLNYIKSHKNALNQFARFLRETGRESFELQMDLNQRQDNIKAILTRKEIQALYEATHYYQDPGITDKGLLAAREKAILGLFYGCGLRRNEGLNIGIKDILTERKLLYVRKGKNYKERYVPITESVLEDLLHYLHHARPQLLRKQNHENLLINWYGKPMKGAAIFERLQVLKEIAHITKPVGLHTLRHSIATHLMESGMKLEQIGKFLGHSSLTSTQIYTHIRNAAL
jgi:integrase/recombinase XerD